MSQRIQNDRVYYHFGDTYYLLFSYRLGKPHFIYHIQGEEMNTTPIEFMAWNGEELIKDFVTFSDKFGYTVNQKMNCGAIAILQRTALRSINDAPIYNHMIVQDSLGNLHEVDMFNYHRMSALAMGKLEIVGNRFQHPELLELCK